MSNQPHSRFDLLNTTIKHVGPEPKNEMTLTGNESRTGFCDGISDRVQRVTDKPVTIRPTTLIISQHK